MEGLALAKLVKRYFPGGNRRSHSSPNSLPRHSAAQIHLAKSAGPLDLKALQPHRSGQGFAAILEQRRLPRSADQTLRQRPSQAPALIQFAELRHRLLNQTAADMNATHQAPIAILAVLLRVVWSEYMRHLTE